MSQYDLTKSRTKQWILIILALFAIAGIYWFFNVRAATTINKSATSLDNNGLVGMWSFDGADVTPSLCTTATSSDPGYSSFTSGTDTYHKFTSSGTLTFSVVSGTVGVLAVGGGGGGGGYTGGGGGGGAGGVNYVAASTVTAIPYTVTVGSGGSGGTSTSGVVGNPSSFNGVTGNGGGYGGGAPGGVNGGPGGSGGGCTGGPFCTGGSASQGSSGGGGINGNWSGGGGGGYGAAGGANGGAAGGNGGSGSNGTGTFSTYLSVTSTGVGGYIAGGGGGGSQVGAGGSGGSGTGGAGGSNTSRNGVNGIVNTGGGGGGGGFSGSEGVGGAGGSGVVIIKTSCTPGSVTDRSSSNNTGTMSTSGPTPTLGKVGQALTFNGTNQYINVGDPVSGVLDFGTNDFSTAAWIKTTETDGQNCILSKAGGPTGFRFGYDTGKPYYLIGDGTHYKEGPIGTTTLNDGSWHFLVIVFSHSTNTAYAYIDGVSVGSDSFAANSVGSISDTDSLYIGSMSGGATGNVTGSIDDVRIYSRALSTGEIASLYALGGGTTVNVSQNSTNTSGLAGLWSFNGADTTLGVNTSVTASGGGYSSPVAYGTDTLYKFTSGTGSFTVTGGSTNVSVLLIGGGGGGGGYHGGGGGAGGVNYVSSTSLTLNSAYNVVVGGGGSAGTFDSGNGYGYNGGDGTASTFNGNSGDAGGGGGGGGTGYNNGLYCQGHNGASGGGGAGFYACTGSTTVPAGTGSQGNNGGTGATGGSLPGGGGGFGGVGVSGPSGGTGGTGTSAYSALLTAAGASGAVAGGGGGGSNSTGTASSGGGAGGGTSGSANTGGGGGGGSFGNGGVGGSGIVIVQTHATAGTVTDRSSFGNTGTMTIPGPTPTIGKVGQALSFNGSTNSISVPDNASLKPTAAISYGGWVYVPSTPGSIQTIMEKGTATIAGYGLYVTTDPKICFTIKTAGGVEINAGGALTTGVWHHVMVTYDSTTPLLYVDGVSQTLASGTGCTASAQAGAITEDTGTLNFGSRTGASQFFNGKLDELRVYNTRALSAGEIQALYSFGSGSTIGFVCGLPTTDIDGNSYGTVLIGSQCWMKENMMTTKYPDGTSITRGDPNPNLWNSADNGYYAYPPNITNTAEESLANIQSGKLGFLYQWSAVMHGSVTPGAQGICPTNWHVPTHDEYTDLERAVCTSGGTCLTDFPKDTTTTGLRGTNEGSKLSTETSSGTNSSGFTAHMSGLRVASFYHRGTETRFWSSSQGTGNPWARHLTSTSAQINRSANSTNFALSVRCVKN